jgi:hypothetical protein
MLQGGASLDKGVLLWATATIGRLVKASAGVYHLAFSQCKRYTPKDCKTKVHFQSQLQDLLLEGESMALHVNLNSELPTHHVVLPPHAQTFPLPSGPHPSNNQSTPLRSRKPAKDATTTTPTKRSWYASMKEEAPVLTLFVTILSLVVAIISLVVVIL